MASMPPFLRAYWSAGATAAGRPHATGPAARRMVAERPMPQEILV